MKIDVSSVWSDIQTIRSQSPLVHNITNYVVMNNTANALLAIGASPVMAHAEQEVADMTRIAKALVINIGTLSEAWVQAMQTAIKQAKESNVPIVLDPVGAGATPYRNNTIRRLLDAGIPNVIRGNGSEILSLVQTEGKTKGVDSLVASTDAVDIAREVSKMLQCTVCISGETDYVVDGDLTVKIKNGHQMMPKVTGLGCTATALCGAFIAVNTSVTQATAHAMAVMGIAGEQAAQKAAGPGSMQMHYIDALFSMTEADIAEHLNVEI